MANTNMLELTDNSIQVIPGMISVFPQFHTEEPINVSELVLQFPGRYATNNSRVAYVFNGNFYVTPYTVQCIEVLEANGFQRASFYVPFSNWDFPKAEKARWESLLKTASESK